MSDFENILFIQQVLNNCNYRYNEQPTCEQPIDERPKSGKAAKVLKKIAKGAAVFAGVAAGVAVVAGTAYVTLNEPEIGKDSPRAHVRRDGHPKVGYDTKIRANAQVLVDACKHHTIMAPYKCRTCDKYHLGHKH